MRDPARIDRVLEAIRQVWVRHPDLRLCQLIVNSIPNVGACPRVFSFEDDALLEQLNEKLRSTPTVVEPRTTDTKPTDDHHAP